MRETRLSGRSASPALLGFAFAVGVAMAPAFAFAQTTFLEVSTSRSIGDGYATSSSGFGTGVAAADFDDDGDIDVFIPTVQDEPHLVYRNRGDGHFDEVGGALGLAVTDRGRAALWLDVDGDTRLDLIVSSDCYAATVEACGGIVGQALKLFRQQVDGTFAAVPGAFPDDTPTPDEHRSGMAAADLDADGDLDLVTGYWMGTLRLYQNDGTGTFADISAAAGLDDAVLGYHQPILQDFDGDGRIDLFTSVDFTENRLWLHQGVVDGLPVFVESAGATGSDNAMNDMGVALGDYDEDGDPDLYVTNIFREGLHNVLLEHGGFDAPLLFTDVSQETGTRDGGWGWGTTFFDVDNDGDLDLAETNGWRGSEWRHPLRLFLHPGPPTATSNPTTGRAPTVYVDDAAAAGFSDLSWGTSLVAADLDRDGDLDLLETVSLVADAPNQDDVRLYDNQLATPQRHALVVKPRMDGANTRAIGARLVLEVPAGTSAAGSKSRWISAGGSYLGQEPAEAVFGVGDATRTDRLTVHWPDGRTTVATDLPPGPPITLRDRQIFANGFEGGSLLGWSASTP